MILIISDRNGKVNNKFLCGGDKKSKIYKKSVVMNSSQAIFDDKERNPTVRKILSDVAGVSEDTYSKGKKILDSDNEEVKQAVLSGDMSINAGYNKIREKQSLNVEENKGEKFLWHKTILLLI